MSATTKSLQDLQDLLAETMQEMLKAEPSAAELNVIRQFLKDHNIHLRDSAGIGALAGALEETEDSELPENVRKLSRPGDGY